MASKIVTGAHVILYVNGERFGSVFLFGYHVLQPSKKIGGIDVPELIELAPTTSQVTGTLGVYRLIGDGAAEGAGMVPVSRQLPRGKYFSMQLFERTSDTVIFSARYCRAPEQSWTFETKTMTRGTISWEALTYDNEVTPSSD